MSTHKWIDRICCIVLAIVLILTVLLYNADALGIQALDRVMGYEEKLFDKSYVHTIDIVMDDWDSFIDTCENEEYAACAVVIDNEAYKNVGIRAKGNTSLSSVAAYGNDRYSFKIEFDKYDSSKTYYGLDKLSLNNIIQDNTYMKDFLTYQMMGYFGVAAPLCSYVYITVNGEPWGLYLAVEGVEDGFLTRNYGNDYGELYKPDSMQMGGGRGNGGDFDPEDMKEQLEDMEEMWKEPQNATVTDSMPEDGEMKPEDASKEQNQSDNGGMQIPGDGEVPEGGSMQMPGGGEMPEGGSMQMPGDGEVPEGGSMQMPGGEETSEDGSMQIPDSGAMSENGQMSSGDGTMPSFGGKSDIGGMGGSMGSSDVSLIYSDDEYESYSNIFDSAKTEIADADKDRLIESIKGMNEQENIEDYVDIESVIRYFVVHNFVCNFDSYTGSMIHNYYLYEEDGKLSMIPWDYNLAFGGFSMGTSAGVDVSGATSLVNYPIDSPVSGGTVDSRPMLAWIFSSEEYTEMYHTYFEEFISECFDSEYVEELIDSTKEMIAPYVEEDPTKFCTYEEFETGIDTLKEFCLLRADSVRGQLDGTIPSTSEEQNSDSETLVDASDITVSAMGSMGNGMGNGGAEPVFSERTGKKNGNDDVGNTQERVTDEDAVASETDAIKMPFDREQVGGMEQSVQQMGNEVWILLGVSVLVMIAGLIVAIKYKRK